MVTKEDGRVGYLVIVAVIQPIEELEFQSLKCSLLEHREYFIPWRRSRGDTRDGGQTTIIIVLRGGVEYFSLFIVDLRGTMSISQPITFLLYSGRGINISPSVFSSVVHMSLFLLLGMIFHIPLYLLILRELIGMIPFFLLFLLVFVQLL